MGVSHFLCAPGMGNSPFQKIFPGIGPGDGQAWKFGIESLQYLSSIMSKNGGKHWCGCQGNQVFCHEVLPDHSLSEC